jgi:hypothetical protein
VRIGYTAGKTDAQIASASRIRQVVTGAIAAATGTTTIADTTTTPTTSNGTQIVTANITPAATANKIRIRASFSAIAAFAAGLTPGDGTFIAAVFRGSTCIGAARMTSDNSVTDAKNTSAGTIAIDLLDSPSTTSATTYSIYAGSQDALVSWYVNRTVASATALGSMMANSIMSLEEIVV